jgi:CRP-like cAMP-binding protein
MPDMDENLNELRELLHAECTYRMKEETMDEFTGLMTEIELKDKEILVPYGKFDNNIYIVREGILRYVYFDGDKEVTFGFALPGTLMISYYSFYKRESSFFQIEACCHSSVMKVAKADFDELTERSNDFALWMLRLSAAQLWHYEQKLAVLNGEAGERLESLFKNRPEIIENVSSRILASYIGIIPSSLSRLKRQIIKKSV